MKLPLNDIKTETSSNMLNEMSFGIGDAGLVFDILRNKLYKNPILAICREISCNARDAHREVGKFDLPIRITIPNAFDPNYRIQDFGPGISPNRIENVFIKYASSTKRDDNTQTGGFGIGGKVPLSYSDSFTVVTITEYVKRTYTAYIDETRVGKMVLSSEESTSEGNGTTIIVPVAKKDFQEFLACTINATEYWPIKPGLLGVSPTPEYPNHTILFSGTGWELKKTDTRDRYNYSYSSSNTYALALIDGIPYRLESNSLPCLANSQRKLLDESFLLHFQIGDLSLSASRDSLYYDDKTQKAIEDRLKIVSEEMTDKFRQQIEACSSYCQASLLKQQILTQLRSFSDEISQIDTWQNHNLWSEITTKKIGEYARCVSWRKKGYEIVQERYSNSSLKIKENNKIFFNDKTQETLSKSTPAQLFKLFPNYHTIQIVSTPRKPMCSEYRQLVKDGENPEVTYDTSWLDLIEAEKLSTCDLSLESEDKTPKDRIVAKSEEIITYKLISSSHGGLSQILVPAQLSEGGIYLEVNYQEGRYRSGNYDFSSMAGYKSLCIMEKFLDKKIVGLTATRIKKLPVTWTPLHLAIEEQLRESLTEITLEQLQETISAQAWLPYKHFHSLFGSSLDNKIKIQLPINNVIRKYLELAEESQILLDKYDELIRVLTLKDSNTFIVPNYESEADTSALCQLYQEVDKTYPLLSTLSRHYLSEPDLQHVFHYIEAIHRAQEISKPRKITLNESLQAARV